MALLAGLYALILCVAIIIATIICYICQYDSQKLSRSSSESNDVHNGPSQQILDDERLARELQGQVEPEIDYQLVRQREERSRKYRAFLKPYTMIVTDSDFSSGTLKTVHTKQGSTKEKTPDNERSDTYIAKPVTTVFNVSHIDERHDDDINDDIVTRCDPISSTLCDEARMQKGSKSHIKSCPTLEEASHWTSENLPCITSTNTEDTTSSSDGDENHVDVELGEYSTRTTQEVQLCLPVLDEHGHARKVNIECSICIMEYEAGDQVVWSTRKSCTHAFHSDCILVWLSKGKKRCPICRNYFVPGQRVDDKDVITHDLNDMEAAMGLHNNHNPSQ